MPAGSVPDLSSVFTVLLAGGQGSRLHELTARECKPALPFAGARLVDFSIANAHRSGLRRLIVATQYRPDTLARHIPARWGVSFPKGGLMLREGRSVASCDAGYTGTAAAVRANLAEIDAAAPSEVLVLAGDHVYEMDYAPMVAAHRAAGAEATVAVTTAPLSEAHAFGVLDATRTGRVSAFLEKPRSPPPMRDHPDRALVSMGIYVFSWPWLRSVLLTSVNGMPPEDFGHDVIPRAVDGRTAFAYRPGESSGDTDGYWRDVGTLDTFLEAHVEFQSATPPFDRPAAGSHLDLLPMPCLTGTARGRTTPLHHRSDRTEVARMAHLRRAVVMPGAMVFPGARLTDTIVGPGTVVPAGLVVGEDPIEDARWFRRTPAGTTLITAEMLARRAADRPRPIFLGVPTSTLHAG